MQLAGERRGGPSRPPGIDGVVPREMVEPASAEDVAAVLASASKQRTSVVIRGGGTKTGWGRTPSPVDVLLSTTFRSDQGNPLQANYVVTSAQVAQTLGRPLSGNTPSITVNLLEPGAQWGDRINEFDLRVAKVLRFGRTRSNVGVDIYNLLNSAAVLTYNQSFTPGGRWLVPTS